MRAFEAKLVKIFGSFQDDTFKLLTDGKLVVSDKAQDDEMNWHDVPENSFTVSVRDRKSSD